MVLNLAFYISLFVLFLKTIHTLKAPHQLSRDVAVNLRHVPNYISGYSSNCAITILHTNIKISQKLNTFWSEIGDSLFPRDDDVEGRYHTYQLHDETKIYTFLPAIQPRPRRCAVVFVTNWFPSAPQDLLQMCLVYNTFRDINDIISGQRDVANVMLLTIMNPARTPLRADHCKRITQARIFVIQIKTSNIFSWFIYCPICPPGQDLRSIALWDPSLLATVSFWSVSLPQKIYILANIKPTRPLEWCLQGLRLRKALHCSPSERRLALISKVFNL